MTTKDPVLFLTVEPGSGHINSACHQAYRIAVILNLRGVSFDFNGAKWTVYQDGTGFSMFDGERVDVWDMNHGLMAAAAVQ